MSSGRINSCAGAEASTLGVSNPEPASVESSQLEFAGGQRLLVERGANADLLTLVAPSGEVVFSIRITPSGPVLRFESGLRIEASGALEIAGKSLALTGEEGLVFTSGGDASIDVAGGLSTTAREQSIEARLGNVKVKANDDVRLNGERVCLNC